MILFSREAICASVLSATWNPDRFTSDVVDSGKGILNKITPWTFIGSLVRSIAPDHSGSNWRSNQNEHNPCPFKSEMPGPKPEPGSIRAQLRRILASREFAVSDRMCRFLRLAVTEAPAVEILLLWASSFTSLCEWNEAEASEDAVRGSS
jgi:hypothetical protein